MHDWREIKRKSAKQERRVAKRMGAKQHGGSGSGRFFKNDMHNERCLIENKRTDNERYLRIDVKEMEALVRRAAKQRRLPVMSIEIGDKEYVVLQDADFQELL